MDVALSAGCSLEVSVTNDSSRVHFGNEDEKSGDSSKNAKALETLPLFLQRPALRRTNAGTRFGGAEVPNAQGQ